MSEWRGRSVLVTGHAGFKGSWLSLYLAGLGARVHGYGRARTSGESLYRLANVRDRLASETTADLRDLPTLRQAIRSVQPDVVFHLAARAIVKEALDDPVGTIGTNVVSSLNVLDAVRWVDPAPKIVLVTTDKVYRNTGQRRAFGEEDALGGLDPYGASKAAVELVADSYRHTYGVDVATARCANVLGGGDWGPYRLMPSCVEAFDRGEAVTAYDAVRVFLYVLDAAAGYVRLAEAMCEGIAVGAYNFGPSEASTVQDIATRTAELWPAPSDSVQALSAGPDRESQHLDICSDRARSELGWRPRLTLDDAIRQTVQWHRAHLAGADMELVTQEQIRTFCAAGGAS